MVLAPLNHLLLISFLRAFAPDNVPVVVGIDETIERADVIVFRPVRLPSYSARL